MFKSLRGVVRGRTIEFAEDLGLPEGQTVDAQIKVVDSTRMPGDGLRRIAGALADDPEWDVIMEEVRQSRRVERR